MVSAPVRVKIVRMTRIAQCVGLVFKRYSSQRFGWVVAVRDLVGFQTLIKVSVVSAVTSRLES